MIYFYLERDTGQRYVSSTEAWLYQYQRRSILLGDRDLQIQLGHMFWQNESNFHLLLKMRRTEENIEVDGPNRWQWALA